MTQRTYRIRMSRGEEQFEAEGDKRFVLDMLKRFEGGSTSPAAKPLNISTDAKTLASSKQVSVGEFIRQLGVKKHTDIVVAFGYYLEEHSGLKDFTPADISNCYYEAKMESSNVSQSIIQNIKRGMIMPAKRDKVSKKGGRYTLTGTGQEFIRHFSEKSPKKK